MTFPKTLLTIGLLCAVWAGGARAEKADHNKPIQVEADALRYDDLKQVSIFTGHVLLTKGSIRIRGTRLEVQQSPEGDQQVLVVGDKGQLASFRQKRDGAKDDHVEAEAESINYDSRTEIVTLTQSAQLRRLRGEVLAEEVAGATIRYNSLTGVFNVDGATDKAAAGTRVRVMLVPKPATPAGPPDAGIRLRPSSPSSEERP